METRHGNRGTLARTNRRRSVVRAAKAWLEWPYVFAVVWWRLPKCSIAGAWAYATTKCYNNWWQAWRGPLWASWEEVDAEGALYRSEE